MTTSKRIRAGLYETSNGLWVMQITDSESGAKGLWQLMDPNAWESHIGLYPTKADALEAAGEMQ